ncbi:MAG: DUF2306 domain-containing protein [Chitinophagaceae bacterium]|nr:DUF2306 domain-containing protein [Chitinophagaceae bacterium]
MNNIVSGGIGLIHLIVSVIALIAGTYVLLNTKGTVKHKKIGYIYVISMILLNITAFMIYRLFGKFGIFHWFAVLSCVTLALGMLPILLKRPKQYMYMHFNYMYWSVVGLYCAFCAEVLTRMPSIFNIPNTRTLFGTLTAVSIFIVMLIASIIFGKNKINWKKQIEFYN